MWNHWTDVTKKLKNIAAEIATPKYEDEDEDGEYEWRRRRQQQGEEGDRVVAHEGMSGRLEEALHQAQEDVCSDRMPEAMNASLNSHSHSVATLAVKAVLVGAAAAAAGVESGVQMTPPVRCSVPRDAILTPPLRSTPSSVRRDSASRELPSTDGGASHGKSPETVETSAASSVLATTATNAVENGGGEAHRYETHITELQKQVQLLLDQKQQMESQILAYQEEVKTAHEKTVTYYEENVASLQQQIDTEKRAKEQLEGELRSRDSECVKLKEEVQRLQQRVNELANQASAMNAEHDKTKKLLILRDQQLMEAAQQIESLQDAHDTLLQEVERTNASATKSQPVLMPVAQSDALMGKEVAPTPINESAAVEELRRRVEILEQEKLAALREKEQVALRLQEELRTHRVASEEKDEMMRRSEEQARRLAQLIERLESERKQERQAVQKEGEGAAEASTVSPLRAEIAALTSQLEAAKQERDEAVQRVEEVLKGEQQTRAAMDALRCESSDAQRCAAEAGGRQSELQQEALQLQSRLAESEANSAALSNKLVAAEGLIAELQSDVAASRRANDGQEASLLAALNARKRELKAAGARLEELMLQLEHTVTDCLVRADTELPPPRDGIGASFSDKITLLASEFHRLLGANQQAAQVQKEWERTYEQARSVNATLTQQVNEAWKTIGTLREELSLREQSLAKLKQQLQAELQQYRDAQQVLASVTNELQVLKEEKKAWETRITETATGETSHQEQLAVLNADVDTLKKVLHERDEELAQAQRSMENLQQVLDTFTQNKTRDVEERTADMQIEIDQLRAQLEVAELQQQQHQSNIDAVVANHRRDMAAKNLEITSFHRKHAELRKALDETARQLNGDTMIDKRVISHLTVNFIHAFVGQRPEGDEMLKVLSGLLNWDEAMQEKAGLLPGPTNPKPGHQGKRGGIIGGLVSSVWSRPRRAGITDGSGGGGSSSSGNESGAAPSIAELWVEFLMRESEVGVRDAAAAAGLPPPSPTLPPRLTTPAIATTTSTAAAAIPEAEGAAVTEGSKSITGGGGGGGN
ncbi:hypothetical protein DQ04_07561020 [Trypanosoma grayi]|uniref:hypothetical protein n=1 Tax=Trypanosoma grayi TaxID=71804 RepID=UPI0004F45E27|nr:hypothetical protein DQ04_07561020 [Trypanosoma grayi]KEG08271.1 hypothetical protein DQ04_07561020 [Trypanosoma grayi]